VCVCDTADYFYKHIEEQLEEYGLTHDTQGRPIRARDLVDIVEGYKFITACYTIMTMLQVQDDTVTW